MLTEVLQRLPHERRGRAISYFSAVMQAGLALAGVELVDLVGYDRAWLTLGVLAVLAVARYLPAKRRQRESHLDEVPAGTPAVVVVGAGANGRQSSAVFTRNLAESLSRQACQLLG
jgi:cyanate permease